MRSLHRVQTVPLPRLRDDYLFGLAHLCHLGARDVDRLLVADFATYIDEIDNYLKAAAERRG